jgi:hypothetical protein
MPKNKVSDPITDQEIAFAHLVFSGTMTDQRAAEAVGLNPATAAYPKSKPRVLAYMLEHRAAVQQHLVEQETEGLRQRNGVREQVLTRLWEIAYMSPEMTRGSITGQIKVLSMIVAIEGLIPERVNGRRAGSAESKLAALPTPQIYVSEWLRKQQEKTTGSQPSPDLPNEDQEEDKPGVPEPEPAPAPPDPGLGPVYDLGESTAANASSLPETQSWPPAAFAPDTKLPFSIKKDLFGRRR